MGGEQKVERVSTEQLPTQVLADQLTQEPLKHFSSPWLTLSQPDGADCAPTLLLAHPGLDSFLILCRNCM